MKWHLFLILPDNTELLGTWRIKDEPNIPIDSSGGTFTDYVYLSDFSKAIPEYGEFRFRVNYDGGYKEFTQIKVTSNNETGEKKISYWPEGNSGVIVYRDGNWDVTGVSERLGYSYEYNKTITIIKSTLTNQNTVNKAYNWLIANATKVS